MYILWGIFCHTCKLCVYFSTARTCPWRGFIFGYVYRYLLYICFLYSLLSVSTADVNTTITCVFLWEYHSKCSWFLCNSFLLDEIPFPLPKSRETKDAVVFNGFHLIGKSLIDPCFMIMNVISILEKVPIDLHQDGLASLLWKHLLENWMCCLALHSARQWRGSHS